MHLFSDYVYNSLFSPSFCVRIFVNEKLLTWTKYTELQFVTVYSKFNIQSS